MWHPKYSLAYLGYVRSAHARHVSPFIIKQTYIKICCVVDFRLFGFPFPQQFYKSKKLSEEQKPKKDRGKTKNPYGTAQRLNTHANEQTTRREKKSTTAQSN